MERELGRYGVVYITIYFVSLKVGLGIIESMIKATDVPRETGTVGRRRNTLF